MTRSAEDKSVVRIDWCRFVNNERALTAVGYYEKLLVENCDFRRNMAMHAGAAILVLTTNDTELVVYACTFTENAAGRYRESYPAAQRNGSFAVVGGEVHLNADCCKGVISLVGKEEEEGEGVGGDGDVDTFVVPTTFTILEI